MYAKLQFAIFLCYCANRRKLVSFQVPRKSWQELGHSTSKINTYVTESTRFVASLQSQKLSKLWDCCYTNSILIMQNSVFLRAVFTSAHFVAKPSSGLKQTSAVIEKAVFVFGLLSTPLPNIRNLLVKMSFSFLKANRRVCNNCIACCNLRVLKKIFEFSSTT